MQEGAKEIAMVSEETVRLMVHQAAEEGAKRALASIGLHDAEAFNDIRDLRDLMKSWRVMKNEAARTFINQVIRVVLLALALGTIALLYKFKP